MDWILENRKITGKYLGHYPVSGIVRESRVAYGGYVKHHIELDNPIVVHGSERNSVMLNHFEIETVEENHAV